MFEKLIQVIVGLILSLYLFYKAAGTLKITKLNIISYSFYLFILQTYIGISLIFLGDRQHYTVFKIMRESSINTTFYCVLFTAIVLPIIIILTNKIFKVNIKKSYEAYMANETIAQNEKEVFLILVCFSTVCIMAMIIMFFKIGYIPLFKMFFKGKDFNMGTERIRVSNLLIFNQYVKNLFILTCIPIFSYLAFVYSYITKKRRWRLLFAILLLSSIFAKTYNFAKTPVIFYLVTYIILYSFLNNGIKIKYLIYFMLTSIILLVGAYLVVGLETSIFDVHNGPIGRTIYTQSGTLIYHFDLFPRMVPFLNGRGFSNIITKILGVNTIMMRSSRVVMLFYGSKHVFAGTAGVMNAFFIGEAYANFGLKGVILSVIYIGILFSIVQCVFLKLKKDAINLTIFSIITVEFSNITQGGFFDFMYNINITFIIITLLLIKILANFIKNKKIYIQEN